MSMSPRLFSTSVRRGSRTACSTRSARMCGNSNQSVQKTVCPELVEGPSFRCGRDKKELSFDKLRTSGGCGLSEADFIARLRGIATDPAARGLADDAAVLDDLVLTHDMIVEGIHFLPDERPQDVAWKLVAVNLSDLAATGGIGRANVGTPVTNGH